MEIVEHCGIKMYFYPDEHLYIDSNGMEYDSVTSVIDESFPKCDSEGMAKAKSEKTGVDYRVYLEEWNVLKENAAKEGTRLHEIAEKVVRHEGKGVVKTRVESLLYENIKSIVEMMEKRYFLEAEKIIFSPKYKIAGMVDVLGTREGEFAIFDWKRIRSLYRSSTKYGFQGVMDCNFMRYSLQTCMYSQILKCEGYIPLDSKVKKFLLVRDEYTSSFNVVCCEELEHIALELLKKWRNKNE